MTPLGVFSASVLGEISRKSPPSSTIHDGPFFGMEVRGSPAFPFTVACTKCGGTGDGGLEATYCRACRGGGAVRYEGAILNGPAPVTMLVIYLPKKFEPRFPFALPLRPLPARETVSVKQECWI